MLRASVYLFVWSAAEPPKLADEAFFLIHLGNHDFTLDHPFYEQAGRRRHNQQPQDPGACLNLVSQSPSITYLYHEAKTVQLQAANGPRTRFTIFGSPYSRRVGLWGFSYDSDDEARELWNKIPSDSDIIVTHTPPKGHCDWSPGKGGSAGCEELRKALWRVRPKLHICGHCHEGRGAERVRWRLEGLSEQQQQHQQPLFMEDGCRVWTDPSGSSKKQSHLDLTVKGGDALDNHDSSVGHVIATTNSGETQASNASSRALSTGEEVGFKGKHPCPREQCDIWTEKLVGGGLAISEAAEGKEEEGKMGKATLRSDHDGWLEAVKGRMGRKETCIVNAAIMAGGHKSGPKQFNKPLVVDIDLPIWEEG